MPRLTGLFLSLPGYLSRPLFYMNTLMLGEDLGIVT